MPPLATAPEVTSYYRTQQGRRVAKGFGVGQLLLELYDHAIAGCVARDCKKVSAALVELIGALNFDYEDIALGLFRLYDWCLRRARAKAWDEVSEILRDLRETWARALKTAEA